MRKFYFGGGFPPLDKNHPEDSMKGDFRAQLLGDAKKLLYPPINKDMEIMEILLTDKSSYVGPYFFYGESLQAQKTVLVENEMIHKCTDAVFLLENISNPGTVTELVNAALLGKNVHVFYISLDSGTPETEINSDQWYPIAFAQMTANNIECMECCDLEDAHMKILSFVESIK